MKKPLRKGTTTIEIWHQYGSDSINAEQTHLELDNNNAVLRTTLKPVDSNQRYDADRVFGLNASKLTKVIFDDTQIRQRVTKIFTCYKINHVTLEVFYNKKYFFEADLKLFDEDGLIFDIQS